MVALLIEEDAMVRAAMCLVLANWGVCVLDVPCIVAAEKAVADAGLVPDIVLTALNVGGPVDGSGAFNLLPPLLARIGFSGPVIVTTGDTSPDGFERIASLGWTRLVKPFKPQELQEAMAASLSGVPGGRP